MTTDGTDDQPSEESRIGDESVSERVVRKVASATDVEPIEMDQTLYDVVDPDALESLVRSGGIREITFSFADCSVQIFGDGDVAVQSDPETSR